MFQASGYGATLSNRGTTLDAVIRRGVRFAVCQMATRACAARIAEKTGVDTWDDDRASAEATALGLTSAALKTFALDSAHARR